MSTLAREDILSILYRIAIFGALTEESLKTLVALLEAISLKDKEVLFKEGDPPDHIYIVRSGRVRIVASREAGAYELSSFGVGECFGEMSVIGIQPHSGSAIADGETELIVLSRKALHVFSETDPRGFGVLILNVAREACRRLFATDRKLLHYAGPE